MIYITVGTQLPFERLMQSLDTYAKSHVDLEFIAQVGPDKTEYKGMKTLPFVSPSVSNQYFAQAEIIVAHAGMGSVLTALKLNKPIIIFPRLASLGEHRNDHQMATARWLESKPSVYVAWDDADLFALLERRQTLTTQAPVSPFANPDLIANLQKFIHSES